MSHRFKSVKLFKTTVSTLNTENGQSKCITTAEIPVTAKIQPNGDHDENLIALQIDENTLQLIKPSFPETSTKNLRSEEKIQFWKWIDVCTIALITRSGAYHADITSDK